MMRAAVALIGATVILAGASALHGMADWGLIAIGVLILLGTVFERWRYRPLASAAPGGFEPTTERFRDPVSRAEVAVYVKPGTGERRYVRDRRGRGPGLSPRRRAS